MLRGSSRHDGIPNKQSARERDRDRLRERQRQERQQMLPNDDKDISVGAQDLFRAPVKVKPSVDDTTTAQIANTLGSFDTVRHLILDPSSRRLTNLIGVDQGSLPGTPVASRQPPQPVTGGGHNSVDHNNKHPSYFHPQGSSSGQSSSGEPANKSHHSRNLFTNSSTNSHVNPTIASNPSGNATNSFISTSADFNFGNYRNPISSKGTTSSSSHSQATHLSNSSSNHTSNSNSATAATSASSQSGALGGSVGYHHSSSSSANNSTSASSVGNSATNSNNSLRNSSSSHINSVPGSNQVRQSASSFNNSFNSNANSTSSVTDSNSDGSVNVSSAKTANSNALLLNKESYDTSASGADEKNLKNASSNKKPALERADSQLEIESMLKEMMDVTAPLTEIQTPVKETSAKKFTQRRSSKSEEKIVQSIRDSGMAHAPSPVQRMDSSGDSSSSYDESETSDSESEDSSSGSQTGGEKIDTAIPKITPNTNSPTRWNLGSFIRKNDYRGTQADANATTTTIGGSKSPKETKPNAHQVNAINSETSPGDVPIKTESIVSSTSLYNKAQSLSPLDTPPAPTPPTTRKITRSQVEIKTEPSPPKPPPPTPSAKPQNLINTPVTKSLSDSSGDEVAEQKQQKKDPTSRPNIKAEPETKTANTSGAATRKRKRNSSSAERNSAQKQPQVEEPPVDAKNKKNNNSQDRNKNDTLRRLFFINKKVDSPTRSDNGELGRSPSSATQNTNGNGMSISLTSAPIAGSSASTNGNAGVPNAPSAGTSGGSSSSNRVQAKDSGKKSKEVVSNNVHNGEVDASVPSLGATATETASKSKRDEGGGTKEKESTSSSRASHGKKNQKSATPVPGTSSSAGKSSSVNLSALLPPPPPPAAKVKEEPPVKIDKTSALSSSLVVKINLNKLKRKPNMMPAPPPPPPLAPPPLLLKIEKESTEKGGKTTIKDHSGAGSSNADLFSKRVHFVSSRVGSSSDHAKDAKETAPATHNPIPGRSLPDGSLCSGIDFKGKKRSKSKKVKSSSPKKTKTKHEPDSHSKVEEDTACGEVSSNVLGYASCDSVSVSTTRTPPVESDVVQAPDSSLNPPHLPSPVVLPQPVYFSYFEKNDYEDYIARRDQDSYLEEAKRLKHKADGERVSTTQASVYLEAGLYFILTGISMERDRTVGSTAAFTMYKDTLVLIRYIGSRFRNRGAEYSNPMEAKIIVLSMRCQSLLSLKLFKIKMRETKDMVQYLQDHFQRHPTLDLPPIASSPQLSTPSPHSPTSSPAASSSLHPSPHHPNQIMTSIPRTLYANMQKTCTSTMNLISAHELWEAADHLVEKYHIEEFFIQLDRQFGPLTLHNSLVDLVRYVKHALQVLKSTSELS